MKNKKGLIIGICFLIILVALVFVYFAFFSKKDNFIKNIIIDSDKPEDVVEGINDIYNGVYVLEDDKGQSITALDGCTFSYVSNYILVIEKDFKVFRSSCLGTFSIGAGFTKDLKFVYNEKVKLYDVEYEGKIYNKDLSVRQIEVFDKELENVRIEYYKNVLDEVKYSKNFNTLTSKINKENKYNVLYRDGIYNATLTSEYGSPMYSYSANSINELPDISVLNGDIIIYEKNQFNGIFNDKLYVYDNYGIKFNLVSQFPIIIDGVSLDYTNSVLLEYNVNKKKYVMYVGYNEGVCSQELSDDRIVYYEFDLEYDYYNKVFKKPYFVNFGKGNTACKKMKELVKER